jgi:hypothetical protein
MTGEGVGTDEVTPLSGLADRKTEDHHFPPELD